jgi:excisionase family DNA binding protein
MTSERLTVNVSEAATMLGISRNSAFAAVRNGQIPALRVGRRLLISRHLLARMIESAASSGDDSAKNRS